MAQPIVAQPGDLICSNCGTPNDPSRHFCRACGRSLATAVPARRKQPWWRRFFPAKKPLEAGQRTARIRAGDVGGGSRVGGLARTVVSSVIVAAVGFGLVGYLAVPSVQSAVNDAIKQVRRTFEQPQHVYPTSADGSSLTGHPAKLAIDKTFNLYWAAPLGGTTPSITFHFIQPTDIVALIATPGALDNLTGYARPKDIRITFSDGTTVRTTLKDASLVDATSGQGSGKVLAYQTVDASATSITSVRLDVLSVYPGTLKAVAVAEVEFFTKP